MKSILLLLTVLTINTVFGQNEKRLNFFGINPNAYQKEMLFSPLIPSSWSNVKLENVMVKDNNYTISYVREDNHSIWTIEQSNPDWNIRIPKSVMGKSYQILGEVIDENEMPLESYTYLGLHAEANLSEEEKSLLKLWAQEQMDLLKSTYPADSLVLKRKKQKQH